MDFLVILARGSPALIKPDQMKINRNSKNETQSLKQRNAD